MNTEIYRFKVETFECMAVSDGTPAYPGPATLFFRQRAKRTPLSRRFANTTSSQNSGYSG